MNVHITYVFQFFLCKKGYYMEILSEKSKLPKEESDNLNTFLAFHKIDTDGSNYLDGKEIARYISLYRNPLKVEDLTIIKRVASNLY